MLITRSMRIGSVICRSAAGNASEMAGAALRTPCWAAGRLAEFIVGPAAFTVPAGGTFNTNFQLGGNSVVVGTPPKTGLFHDANGNPFAFDPASNPAASFRFPYPGESGTRNNFRGQGFVGIDMGVNKTFRFTERHSLRFSAYAYNLTNSVRFDPATITFNNALTNTASLGVCFAKILCALKIARFPAATAVPSRFSLHPREPRISRRNARAVYLYI